MSTLRSALDAPVNLIHSQSRAPSLPGASARLAQWLMRLCLYALYIVCRSELMYSYEIREKMAPGCSPVSYLVSVDLFGWTHFCRKTICLLNLCFKCSVMKHDIDLFTCFIWFIFLYLFTFILFICIYFLFILFFIFILFIYFPLFVFLLCNNININTAIEATFYFYFYLQNYVNLLYRLKPTVSVLLGSHPN